MVALARLPMLRPPFASDERGLLGAVHARLQRGGFEAVLVFDQEQGEVIYVGACLGDLHWRVARTFDGDAVEISELTDDHARFIGDQTVPALGDAFAAIVGRMQAVLSDVGSMVTSAISARPARHAASDVAPHAWHKLCWSVPVR